MSTLRCATPLSYERFVDYWFGDLTPEAIDELEQHLLSCSACAERAETFAIDTQALAEAARELPRSFLLPEELEALGERAQVLDVPPAREMTVRLSATAIHVFRVSLDAALLGALERLDLEYWKEGYDEPIFHVSDVPLSGESGALHFACHRHVLNAHGNATMRLIGTRNGERSTLFETLVRFV